MDAEALVVNEVAGKLLRNEKREELKWKWFPGMVVNVLKILGWVSQSQ